MYTLWQFNVDAFLEQYDEASMCLHIFASLHGYPGKWACTLDEGKDISMQDLLMHMEKMFGNKRKYDAMIRTLYEVQQKEAKTVEEYMLHIHDAVMVIHRTYLECLPDRGRRSTGVVSLCHLQHHGIFLHWVSLIPSPTSASASDNLCMENHGDLKKDCLYHELHPYLHDALSFVMAELPKREQACPTFNTLYTLVKKLEAGQPAHTCWYAPRSDAYREKHRCCLAPAGRVAALEEEGVVLADPTSREDSESEVEAVDGLSVHLAQAMHCYQREEQKCFVCRSPGHFARDCPHCNAFKRWHREQLNTKGVGQNSLPASRTMNQQPEVNVRVTGRSGIHCWRQGDLLHTGSDQRHSLT